MDKSRSKKRGEGQRNEGRRRGGGRMMVELAQENKTHAQNTCRPLPPRRRPPTRVRKQASPVTTQTDS